MESAFCGRIKLAVVAAGAMAAFGAWAGTLNVDGTAYYTNGVWNAPATGRWYQTTADWKCVSNNLVVADTFPRVNDLVMLGNWDQARCGLILEAGLSTPSFRGLCVAWGNGGKDYTLILEAGSYLKVVAKNANLNYEGVRIGDYDGTYGHLFVDGGCLDANAIRIGRNVVHAGNKQGRGELLIFNDGVVTNAGGCSVGATGEGRIQVTQGRYIGDRNYEMSIGKNAAGLQEDSRVDATMNSHVAVGGLNVNGSGAASFEDSRLEFGHRDWSLASARLTMQGNTGQTNTVTFQDSTVIVYNLAWEAVTPTLGCYRWAHWMRMDFKSQGYSEIVQDNSVVTNCGIWFWPAQNAGNVNPLKPPRYTVRGGELYVHNLHSQEDVNRGGASQGMSANGIAAFTNAPNSGTISLVDAPKVSLPGVNTNLLLSGNVTATVFGVTPYRPHFEFVLTKKGHRPVEIRNQKDVLGMYSFVPQGGFQVVQTNRFALYRHKTASSVMTTVDEPQFRAPNAALWTTGGFADVPREWGVALKGSSEIVSGADLGAGVACGWIALPKQNPDTLKVARLHLRLLPQTKTLTEIAADLNAAGYPAVCNGADEVVVDLIACGMLSNSANNKVILDFNAPQDAVGVRDQVVEPNARVLLATTEYVGGGFTFLVR